MNWHGAVVRVWDGLPSKGGTFVGTAFFIDSQTLLTAKHVVENRTNDIYLDGMPDGGKEKIETDHIYLSNRDIAILKTSRSFSGVPAFKLNSTELEFGQTVTLAGFIDDVQSINLLTSEIAGHVSMMHTWRTQGSISKGMSGGPVVDPNNLDVIGVIQARDAEKNLSYLISTDIIFTSLKQAGMNEPLPRATLYNVPSLPSHYIERNEHIDKIKKLLLQNSDRNVGITGISNAVGIQGMGGIGKSIIATAIAHDEQIRAKFSDGIIWVPIGQTPDIIVTQSSIFDRFNVVDVSLDTPQQGLSFLNKYLENKRILLILDDVWKVSDLQNFDISSPESKLLITTRHAQVLRGAGAEEYKIDILPHKQAMDLLRIQSKWAESDLPEEAEDILKNRALFH